MNKTRFALPVLALACTLALLRCGNLQMAGGSDNPDFRIIGMVRSETGIPQAGVRVTLIHYTYNPSADAALPDSLTGITDNAGNYSIVTSRSGTFNVLVEHPLQGTKALVCGLSVSAGQDTLMAQPATLLMTGRLAVATSAAAGGYVYLPGTMSSGRVAGGTATLDSVPAGFIPAAYYANTLDSIRNHVIKTSFTIAPGVTKHMADYYDWGRSKTLFLNTTASGANVAATVTGFPVLVRLSGANFAFSEAMGRGEDLRFAKTDATPLAYEIEQWDSAGASAAIWVLLDTIHGNNNTQNITMYWGASAGASSNSTSVFDTARGFQGVWHLGQNTGAAAPDATPNRYNGTPTDTAPVAATGIIGRAQRFNGVSNGIVMNGTASGRLDFPENGVYSLSAWVYADTIDEQFRLVASKGHEQYYLKLQTGAAGGQWEFVQYLNKTGWVVSESRSAAAVKSWHLLTGVRSGSVQRLYMDGVQIDTTWFANADSAANRGDDFSIGKYVRPVTFVNVEGLCHFKGRIDEVRVSSVAYGADWIRLCFMNQKSDDALVRINP